MAKASTRFRNRKINFKTRITVRVGSNPEDYEDFDPNHPDEVDGEGEDGANGVEETSTPASRRNNGISGTTGGGVDTGVDKEEEGEVHLQAVLAAAAASAISRSTSSSNLGRHSSNGGPSTRGNNHDSPTAASSSAPSSSSLAPPPQKAYIPTPSAQGLIPPALFTRLYPPSSWVDPVSYIRFSDTVEDAQIGAIGYTMDDEDEEWLEEFNKGFDEFGKWKSTAASNPGSAASLVEDSSNASGSGRSARERKGKGERGKNSEDKSLGKGEDGGGNELMRGPITDDDFEAVMELFEKVTEDKAPMAHVDTSLLPPLADLEPAFTDPLSQPSLASLKIFAKSIYPHWKERRLKRGGKCIIPQLDYDESNESNPYVCFRRRELKTSRKTRRSDAQNIERLVRLRNDLHCAHTLMLKTRDRERVKLASVELERKTFEERCRLREIKRKLGEAEGDEDLLVARREKKRRREDVGMSGGSLRLSLRKPDPSNFSASSLASSAEELKARKERASILQSRIEKDEQKKRDADHLWDDWTDGAYCPRLPTAAARLWRTVEAIPASLPPPTTTPLPSSATTTTPPNSAPPQPSKFETFGFANAYQPPLGKVRTSFRRRVGRGGRVMLDRIAPGLARKSRTIRSPPAPTPSAWFPNRTDSGGEDERDQPDEDEDDEDPAVVARREERFRYDMDVSIDFPTADDPILLDDFEFSHLVTRSTLLRPTDVDSITLDGSYIDEAYRWAAQEPDRHVAPPLMYGRPPPRPMIPVQAGGPGGVPMQGGGGGGVGPGASPVTAAAYSQMQMMAANNAVHRAAQAAQAAQQQAAIKRQSIGGVGPGGVGVGVGGQGEVLRKTSSSGSPMVQQGLPLPMQLSIPMPMPMPMPMSMNGSSGQQQQLGSPWMNGAGGGIKQPDGLSSLPPGFSQQSSQQQQRPLPNGLVASLPPGSNGIVAGRPPFPNPQALQIAMEQQVLLQQQQQQQQQQVPSRPGSAASSHHSPASQGVQRLPSGPVKSNLNQNGQGLGLAYNG